MSGTRPPSSTLHCFCSYLDYSGCCDYVEASGKNYTLLNQDTPTCECNYRLDSDYTANPEGFCFSQDNSSCLDSKDIFSNNTTQS